MIDKRLIGMMGDSKRYIAKNVALQWLALAANVAMIFAVSRYLGALYDQLTIGDTMAGAPNLPLTLGIVAAALLVRAACTRGAAAASYNASRTVKKTLRSAIYEKLLRLGGSYTQAVPTAEVLQLAGEGVEQLETYFGAYLPQFFYAMLAPVTLFVVLAPVSVKAAVILMICVPLIPVSIVAVQKFAKRLLGKYWGQYAALGDSFLENLQGLTTLKIYQADEARHQAMNREAEHFRKVTMKVLTMQLNSIIVMDIIAYGGAALGIGIAARELAVGHVSLSGALCILLLSADFFLPMRALGSYFHVAMNGMAASDKIFKLLDLPEATGKTAEPDADCAIHCRDLHFGYAAEKETLHGLNLDFSRGSFTALVGESGCGKSTIAAVLTGRAAGYPRQRDPGRAAAFRRERIRPAQKCNAGQPEQPLVQRHGGREPAHGRAHGGRQRPVGCAEAGAAGGLPAQRKRAGHPAERGRQQSFRRPAAAPGPGPRPAA